MKTYQIVLIGVAAFAGGLLVNKLIKKSPSLKVKPFTSEEMGGVSYPVVNFEVDGNTIDKADTDGQGTGSYGDNIWHFQRFDKTYLISAYNTKTNKASAVVTVKK